MSDENRGVHEVPVDETMEETAMTEASAEPEPAEPMPPESMPAVPEPAEPPEPRPVDVTSMPMGEMEEPLPRKNTGLIVVVASIVLVLLAVVFAGPALYTAVIKQNAPAASASAPAKAKITVAIGFVKALLNGDTLAIKGYLPPNVQSAITDAQWADLAAQDSSPSVQFADPKWSGDTTAVVALAAQDATGSLTFGLDAAKPLAVVMRAEISGTTEIDTITLVQVGSGWGVVSISNGTETTVFDAKLVQSMVATGTAEPATSTP